MSDPTRADRVRQVVTLAAAVGQSVIPSLLPPRFAPGQEPPNVMQPTPATFAIWLPIFATSLAHGIVQALPSRRGDPTFRAIGWPAAAAYGATAVWAPLVAGRRYWAAQGALVAIAGCAEVARRRLAAAVTAEVASTQARRTSTAPLSMLAGWGAAASVVNLAAMLIANRLIRPGRSAQAAGVALTAATAVAATQTALSAPGGTRTASARGYLATVAWALAGVTAGQHRRSPAVAATAAAGLLGVAAVLAASVLPSDSATSRPLDR